jgi:hypothetical protein
MCQIRSKQQQFFQEIVAIYQIKLLYIYNIFIVFFFFNKVIRNKSGYQNKNIQFPCQKYEEMLSTYLTLQE